MSSIVDGNEVEFLNDLPKRNGTNIIKNGMSEVKHGYRLFKTIAMGCTFLIMGLSSPLLGASYVHLERIFHVDAQTVSVSIVIASAGYLTGAIVCALLYDEIMPEISFTVVNTVGVMFAFVAGYARDFRVFEVAMFFHEVAFGFNDAAGQSYCVTLWNGHRLLKPLLQGMHAIWSLGGVFGPMVIKLFLCELETKWQFNDTTINPVDQNTTTILSEVTTSPNYGCVEGSVETARYAFMTLGTIAFVANIPFVILCLKGLLLKYKTRVRCGKAIPTIVESSTVEELVDNSHDNEVEICEGPVTPVISKSRAFTFVHVGFIFIFTMLNLYSEFLPILFLVSFALKHLHWSVAHSSLLLSVYFGAHFTGRILGVFISIWLSPVKMMGCNLILTAAAHLLMLTVNEWPAITWISVALAGFGVSTIFPTNVLWISETTPVTGKIGAMMIIGMCTSTMSSPYIVAWLTTNFSQMWFVYVLVIGSLANILVFIVEVCFIRMFS